MIKYSIFVEIPELGENCWEITYDGDKPFIVYNLSQAKEQLKQIKNWYPNDNYQLVTIKTAEEDF